MNLLKHLQSWPAGKYVAYMLILIAVASTIELATGHRNNARDMVAALLKGLDNMLGVATAEGWATVAITTVLYNALQFKARHVAQKLEATLAEKAVAK